jgi:hypothetical protein
MELSCMRLSVVSVLVALAAVAGARPAWAQDTRLGAAPPAGEDEAEFETLSLFDAATLGQHRFAVHAGLGFPYLSLRAQYGVTDKLDVVAAVNSVYFQLNEAEILVRRQLWLAHDRGYGVAARLGADGSCCAQVDSSPAQYSGQRDFSVQAGLVASARGAGGTVFFLDAGLQVVAKLHPVSAVPLSGLPGPSDYVGPNVPVHLGTEVALGTHASFFAMMGLDMHLRRDNAAEPLVPTFALGIELGT